MTISFEIQGLPKMTNTLRKHWRVILRERNKWKDMVKNAVLLEQKRGARIDSPLTKAKVTITRFSARAPDYDGMVSAGKALLDGLVEAGVLADDNFEVIGAPQYLWEYARPKQGKIKVKVESL